VRHNPDDKTKISILVLGGLEEVGKNMILYEYRDFILIIDCGLKFAKADQPGVDYIVNDFSYLIENQHRISGMVITHAHLDHIGALHLFLNKVNVPIWATPFTRAMVEKSLADKCPNLRYKIKDVKKGKSFPVGPFTIDPIHVNHSIPDAIALAIQTPAGTIIHTGDFKIDASAQYEPVTDLTALKRYGSKGVLCLVSDSTNAINPGHSLSESDVSANLEQVLLEAEGRVILATFASQIHRIQKLLEIASRTGRKVFMTGRSMLENTEAAIGVRQFRTYENTILVESDLRRIQKNKILILATGSQGEQTAGLSGIASGRHKVIKLEKEDTILFSSSTIPGNETSVNTLINKLMKEGVKVVTNKDIKIHTTGHGYQEELKTMLKVTRPKFFIPFHGETVHLMKHRDLALEAGINKFNIFLIENGQRVEVGSKGLRLLEKIKMNPCFVENDRDNGINEEVVEDRVSLGRNGLVIYNVRGSEKGIQETEIVTKGFVHRGIREDLFEKSKKSLVRFLEENAIEIFKDRKKVEQQAKKELKRFFEGSTGKTPSIYVFLNFQVAQPR